MINLINIISQRLKCSILIVVLGVIYIVISICCSRFGLKTTEYDVNNIKISSKIIVMQLTDIHNNEFGQENEKLISKIKKKHSGYYSDNGRYN